MLQKKRNSAFLPFRSSQTANGTFAKNAPKTVANPMTTWPNLVIQRPATGDLFSEEGEDTDLEIPAFLRRQANDLASFPRINLQQCFN